MNDFLTNNKFDLSKFNTAFEKQIIETKLLNDKKDKEKLDMLNNQPSEEKKLYDMSIADYIIGIKDTWFIVIDNCLKLNFDFNYLEKENRIFFIGLTFVLIALFMYIWYNFFEEKNLV